MKTHRKSEAQRSTEEARLKKPIVEVPTT